MSWHALGFRFVAGVGVLALLVSFVTQGSAQRADEDKTVRGTVESFTTAPKGEVDGMELSDGTVVHWPPHLEKRFTAIVARGERVEVAGRFETTPEGTRVLEVRSVTNLRTRVSRENEDAPPL